MFTSCKHDNPEPTYTNTVILYFPWSGSRTSASDGLYDAFIDNIESIKSAIVKERGLANNRLMVIIATSATEGHLSEVVYNNGKCQEVPIKEYSNWSFTTKANITTMFNDVAINSHTPTYSMLIGSHGMGWLPRESQPGKAYAFGGVTPEMMTNIDVLDSAIVESSVKHLQYLCFDDCYMANLETAYQLRDATDYLIASTSEIMSIGLPYSEIWTYMKSSTPNYSAIVNKFNSFYSTYENPYGALSVTDCRKTEQAATLMKQLNTLMAEKGISASSITPQALDGFKYHVFFDMKDYTDRVFNALGGNTSLSSDFDKLFSDMVVAHSCTPKLFSVYLVGNEFSVSTNSGLTISDPTVNSQAVTYIKSTAWWKATH